jgi:hypothetical protein
MVGEIIVLNKDKLLFISIKRLFKYIASLLTSFKAIYSAFVELNDTISCFLIA